MYLLDIEMYYTVDSSPHAASVVLVITCNP